LNTYAGSRVSLLNSSIASLLAPKPIVSIHHATTEIAKENSARWNFMPVP
jgi:hypothetical protein